ncbi:MAG: sigma-70 family RNA polymerase sigma factor, partial [Sphingobium sp.]
MEPDELGELADDRPSPKAQAIARDEFQIMLDALNELPERTRKAIEMHRIEGKRLTEIAAHFGISQSRTHFIIVEGLRHCMKRRNP